MGENKTILGILSSAVGEYLGMRTDNIKKKVIVSMSIGFSRLLSIIIITLILLLVIAIFSFAFITMLADATGSIGIAALIVGSVYLVAVGVLIILRKRLFLKFFTSLFSGIIEQDESEERLKPLLLMIVKNLRDTLEC